jgi:hypothetical protein
MECSFFVCDEWMCQCREQRQRVTSRKALHCGCALPLFLEGCRSMRSRLDVYIYIYFRAHPRCAGHCKIRVVKTMDGSCINLMFFKTQKHYCRFIAIISASPPVRRQTSNSKFLHYDRPICCLLKFIATPPARNPVIKQQNICCGSSKLQNRPDLLSKQQTANRFEQCIWASSNAFEPSTISRTEY